MVNKITTRLIYSIYKIIPVFIICCNPGLLSAQSGHEFERKLYPNGNIKQVAFRNLDTVEYRSYFKSGQLKDSIFLLVRRNSETPVKTHKSYYKNGKVASVTVYGKKMEEYLLKEYRSNGRLRYFEQRPTGYIRYFNKNGKPVREFDMHNASHVRVPKRYLKGRHLAFTSFATRIKTKKASLVYGDSEKKLKTGILISIKAGKDTNLLRHCLIEGFSTDSIYLSKFSYNKTYDRIYDFDVLEYKKTFALSYNQLKLIYYTRHNKRGRRIAAKLSYGLGLTSLVLPIALIPGTIKGINEGNLDYQATGVAFGSTLLTGIIFTNIGKGLYRSAVPKKYDMTEWKIYPKL